MNAIPKTIHYCWFGGKPLPESAKEYIATWRKYMPDYQIKEWNESNFDVNIIPYTAAAYKDKKYAFVSDYARFWVLYNYGGVYFDTDVKMIRSIDDIVAKGPFMGIEISFQPLEHGPGVAPGLGIGVQAGNPVYKAILGHYAGLTYGQVNDYGRQINVVDVVSRFLKTYGLVEEDRMQNCGGIDIYPSEYFCPFGVGENGSYLKITDNTRTIHMYAGTWLPKSVHIKNWIGDLLGREFMSKLVRLKSFFKKRIR